MYLQKGACVTRMSGNTEISGLTCPGAEKWLVTEVAGYRRRLP